MATESHISWVWPRDLLTDSQGAAQDSSPGERLLIPGCPKGAFAVNAEGGGVSANRMPRLLYATIMKLSGSKERRKQQHGGSRGTRREEERISRSERDHREYEVRVIKVRYICERPVTVKPITMYNSYMTIKRVGKTPALISSILLHLTRLINHGTGWLKEKWKCFSDCTLLCGH